MVDAASRSSVTGSDSHISLSVLRQAITVGLAVMTIYLLLLPFVERTWRTTGDEPHYLLTAHSLIDDGDLDLTNNYAQLDYLNFYFSRDITPQIRSRGDGQQILDHQLGLPVLIASAYAWGQRYGVLVLQIFLTGILAALTYYLATEISKNPLGSLIATCAVMLTPPLIFYPYLIYPELIGALLTTWVIIIALRNNEPGAGSITLTTLALLLLPWLNRRFVPLTIILILLLAWTWIRTESKRQLFKNGAWLALAVPLISIGLLWWFNAQFAVPTRVDISAPTTSLLWSRLGRGIGWLVDQQRGLFIYAPIYIGAMWGLPILLQESWQQRDRRWWILLPFLVSWGVTTVAGGYWIAWELGPRFLIVALPALAPLLALAWHNYHRYWLTIVIALILFIISWLNVYIILRNPELPYKSSLPLYYEEMLGWPFTTWLPDLAENLTLTPEFVAAKIDSPNGSPNSTTTAIAPETKLWLTEGGKAQDIFPPVSLPELPFGHYTLTWPLQLEANLSPETEVVRLTGKLLGGGQLFNHTIKAGDLPQDGTFGEVKVAFFNTNIDRWRTPLVLSAVSSGQSMVVADDLVFSPQLRFAWLLPYGSVLLLFGAALFTWYRVPIRKNPALDARLNTSRLIPLLGAILLLLVGTVAYLIYQNSQNRYTYDATVLSHFVGQPVEDAAATDGRGWRVDPAVDQPQKAIYGPFDFYEAGLYQVTFRMKTGEAIEGPQAVARLQVNATANFDELVSQAILPEHFSQPDLYHHFVLTVNNPRRQALSFDVHYTGLASLVIDEVVIEVVEDSE